MELSFNEQDCFERAVADQVDVARVRELAKTRPLRVKLGIDPTSVNIHIGRSIPLWRLRAFQELGHRIEMIVGDYTGQVGDTSDKESERPMLTEEQIKANLERYEEQLWMILNPEKKDQVTFSYNSTWLGKLTLSTISHLADAFSVNQFIKRELIARRLEAGSRVSLREMLYPLMQGYDSIQVKADVEMGGKDQWFNLLAGRILQEAEGMDQQAIIVNPLISGTDGRKMSSSWGNGIYLLDTPQDKFGKCMTILDSLLEEYLIVFPRSAQPFTAEELKQRLEAGENPRDLKLQLAERLVALYHGEEEGARCREAFINQFSKGELPEDIEDISLERFGEEKSLVHIMVTAGLAPTNTEARRLIQQGAVRYKGEQVISESPNPEIQPEADAILQVGKRKFIRFV